MFSRERTSDFRRSQRRYSGGWPLGGLVFVSVAVVAWMLLADPATDDQPTEATHLPEGALLRVGQDVYGQEDLLRLVEGAEHFTDPQEAQLALERLIDDALLSAVGRKYAEKEATLGIETVLREEVLQGEEDTGVSESDVAAFYKDHLDDYVHPRLVWMTYLRVRSQGDEAERLKLARTLYVRAQISRDDAAFSVMLRQVAALADTGVLGPIPCADRAASEKLAQDAGVPAGVVFDGCNLDVGVTSLPFTADGQTYLVRKTSSVPARRVTLAQARESIERQLALEQRVRTRKLALEKLRNEVPIVRDEIALQRLVLVDVPRVAAAGVPQPPTDY